MVHLRAIGNAPILKQTFFKLSPQKSFGFIIQFIKKELGQGKDESLVKYDDVAVVESSRSRAPLHSKKFSSFFVL